MQLVTASTFTFGDALLAILEFALLFFWIWIAITVVIDIFRSHDLSGWAKALWLLAIVFLPLVGVLIYLIARGDKMRQHQVSDANQQDAAMRQYIRQAASSPADNVAKLQELRDQGVIDDAEFERAKEKALA